ncbi:hypothetical protein AX14_011735 [Amanita brunnescens Koide BX004]|nr:hypothetical protein AX14_011735 [Amanita brunnescens Koide BX004]
MYRPTSPYGRPKSPYNPPAPQAQSTAPSIAPGTITYTTSAGPDGRTVYQPFKAVAASYQTPSGIVHGIQWVPAEATQILPQGAQPATQEFTASWERGGYNDQAYTQDRQREEEKRRRRKEKEEAKAQERRRNSTSASVGFPSPNPGGQYPTSPYVGTAPTSPYVGTAPYSARDRKPSYSDLSAQFNDINITGRPRKYSTSEGAAPMGSGGYGQYGTVPGPYSKPYAAAGPHISAYSNPSPNMRAADVLPSVPQPGYPASPYTSTGKNSEPIARASSPYGYTQPPRSRATTPIPGAAPSFPQPRSRAASPVPGYAQPRSRAASPMPGGMPLPPEASFDRHQPTIPDCFSRPLNTTHSYPAFDPIKIQEMDEFLERLPKLPLVLQSHDVTHHDWIRLTQDLSLTWSGKMPVPPERAANPPKRANVVAELLHAWNTSFFMPRGAEVVLYKGSTRFSGSKAGITDLPNKHDEDDSDDSESSSEESSEDEHFHNPQPVGLYGGAYAMPSAPSSIYSSESSEGRRRRREEKKRRRKEKRMKRKQREREKKYSLYVTYKSASPMPGGYPAPRSGVY